MVRKQISVFHVTLYFIVFQVTLYFRVFHITLYFTFSRATAKGGNISDTEDDIPLMINVKPIPWWAGRVPQSSKLSLPLMYKATWRM